MTRVVLLVAAIATLYAQEIAFEVASIKPSTDNSPVPGRVLAPSITGGPGTATPNQISYRNMQLVSLISKAFGLGVGDLANAQVIGPQLQFDIVANVPAGATPAQVALMEQHLLRERFGLRYHREPRTRQVYIARVGKDGPKFKESAPVPPREADAPPVRVGPRDDEGFPTLPPEYTGLTGFPSGGAMRWAGQRVKVSDVLRLMQPDLGRPVIDETGLTGLYDFRIAWSRGRGAATDDLIPTPQDAIKALGLTLESGEAPVEVFVIDAIHKTPSEN